MTEPVGDGGRARLAAMILDNFLAAFLGILAAALVPGSDVLRGLTCCAVYLAYYFLSEGLWARTLGKRLARLEVRGADGTLAGWRESAIRTALRLVEANPILFGSIPAGLFVTFSKRKQRLGDILAQTVVIRRPVGVEQAPARAHDSGPPV